MHCTVDLARIRAAATRYQPLLLMAKANCYGLGLPVARALEPQVCGYGVAFGEEGAALRAYTAKPILVATPYYRVQDLVSYRLTPMVGSVDEVRRLGDVRVPMAVHILLNTGLNRFGVANVAQLRALMDAIDAHPYLSVGGVATHYAHAATYADQNKIAAPLLSYIYARVGPVPCHSRATATASLGSRGMVRVGMGVYRGSVTLQSTILAIQHLRAGQCAGYAGAYTAPEDCAVAVVAGGYADGVARCMAGYRVRCRGALHPIVAVCMDVALVALTCPCAVGDSVCLLDADSVDPPQGLYEMYTNIGHRFVFDYRDAP